jgi:hypothetical protein
MSSALNVLSGIGAAVAGLAGEKVSESGSIPGFDLNAIVPALLGKAAESSGGGVLGGLASMAAKSGLLKNVNIAELAGTLITIATTVAAAKKPAQGGVAGLAAAIVGNSGKGADLSSIATMATTLLKSSKGKQEPTSIATELGKTLASSCGVSFSGGATAVKALDSVMGGDVKAQLFKAVLKGIG